MDGPRVWFPDEDDLEHIVSHYQGAVYDSRNHRAALNESTWKHFQRSQDEFLGLIIILSLLPRYIYHSQAKKALATDDLAISFIRHGHQRQLVGRLPSVGQFLCCLALSRSEREEDLELANNIFLHIPNTKENAWLKAWKPLFPW